MGFGDRLIHQVIVERFVVTLDGSDDPVLDDYGQPVGEWRDLALIPALVQPKSATEMAASHEAGAPLSDHTIYMFPRDITTADRIRFASDAPDVGPHYNVVGVRDAAGITHHYEVDATMVGTRHFAGS